MADIDVAVEMGADFVALSFVRNGIDMIRLVELLEERGSSAGRSRRSRRSRPTSTSTRSSPPPTAMMVARGDYGVEAGFARVPLMQKDTIYRATQAGKLVITATQMFESMINAPEPTRAEAADVANAVIDGTSAVMLSAETSIGSYPVQAVLAMSDIAIVAEESSVIRGGHEPDVGGTAAAVMHAAITLADDVDAVAVDRADDERRNRARVREVPPPAADHRARARPTGREPARARVGRPRGDDRVLRERRRPRRRGAGVRRARPGRPETGRPRGADGGPAVRLDRRDEPHRAAPDPARVVGGTGGAGLYLLPLRL